MCFALMNTSPQILEGRVLMIKQVDNSLKVQIAKFDEQSRR